jgi:hypothetical protein
VRPDIIKTVRTNYPQAFGNQEKMLIAPIRIQMGAFNMEWGRDNTFNWKGGDWKQIVGFKISIQVFIGAHPQNSGSRN